MINVMPVDREKLERELKLAGYSMQGFSNAIGRNGSYISAMMREHKGLNKSVVMLLESVAGIMYDSIKPDKKPEQLNNHGFVLGGFTVEKVEPLDVKSAKELSQQEFTPIDKFCGVLNGVRCSILNRIEEVEISRAETGSYGAGFSVMQNEIIEALYTIIYEILNCIDFESED